MLFFDRYHLRETRFSGIEVIRKARVIEQKRQKRKKTKKAENEDKPERQGQTLVDDTTVGDSQGTCPVMSVA